MRPEDRDAAFLWDMHEAAKGIVQMTEGVDLLAFQADQMRRLAVERQLTILGEAARRISTSFRESHPEIPWVQIIALRNLVTHEFPPRPAATIGDEDGSPYSEEYDRGNVDTIWQIATESVPELLGPLAGLVPPLPEDNMD
jgi:uncharacterized protein with HEPN domain